MNNFVPTPKLRFCAGRLQQWFAEDLPGYMRDNAKGEWREVPSDDSVPVARVEKDYRSDAAEPASE